MRRGDGLIRPALALVMLLTLCGPAYAVPTWDNVWRKITMLYPEDGGVTFYVDGAPEPNPSGTCEKNRLIVKTTDANYDAKVSAILTAYSLGHRVRINYLSETLGQCVLEVNRFFMQP